MLGGEKLKITKKEILGKMREQWSDWEKGSHELILKDVEALKMMPAVEQFAKFNWQEQDAILFVLQAIRGVE
jgi:hypothetical protein